MVSVRFSGIWDRRLQVCRIILPCFADYFTLLKLGAVGSFRVECDAMACY